ncbi:hypothetical protein pipiens_016954 [Culex pipiens pipiens]|uniref:Endonuclease/exonuclease/phosphatase domain-containing protein n=1 Tax=Culex pipiens pipiens TaxID=38569 RepID=A0ABD1CJ65_CULPP
MNASIDVIVIGETWIKQGRSQYYNIPGYHSAFSCRKTSAGGLAIFVRNDLNFEAKTNVADGGFHHISVKVDKSPSSVFVHGLYRPPSDDTSRLFSAIEEILANSDPASPCFIVGDVNVPVNQPHNVNVRRYNQLLNAFSATVSNTIITRPISNNLLDHVVCSIADSTRVSNYTMPCELSDHSYVLTVFKLKADHQRKVLTKTWVNYALVDAEFQRFLENFNQNSLPVDECLQSITGTFSQLIQANSRTRTVEVKVKNDCCPWYNFDIWKLGNIRDSILKRWKRNRQDQHLSELLARANYNLSEAKKRAKKQYHTKLFNNGNAKLLWGRINELMGGKSRTNSAPSLEVNQNIEHDPVTVANLFNDHFVSVGDNLASQLTSDGNINRFNTMKRSNISIFLRPASILEISNLIHELDPKKASGYDGFPVSALKKHRNLLSAIICNCFNQCLLDFCELALSFCSRFPSNGLVIVVLAIQRFFLIGSGRQQPDTRRF